LNGGASQLPLPFLHRPDYAEAGFVPASSNEAARAWLARTPDWPSGRFALWGEAGCGKTHLLHIWARRAGAALLQGGALADAPVGVPLAIDAADAALADERRLLHLLNTAAEECLPVLLAARLPPSRWKVTLPDLGSRLRATPAARIDAAEDDLLRVLLRRLLAERQISVAASIQDWLLLRLPRSPSVLREAAARLDAASLAAGGKVSRAVAAAVLAEFEGAAQPDC